MTDAVVNRLTAFAALIAGFLRVVASFLPATLSAVTLEWLYLLIDVAILFALVGIYAYQRAESGVLGFIGFVVAVAGTESIGGPDGSIGDLDVYQTGAAVVGVGMLLFAAGSLKAAKLPRYVPVLWIVSTLAGSASFVIRGSDVPFVIAGTAFGLGFIGAGLHVWAHPTKDVPRLN